MQQVLACAGIETAIHNKTALPFLPCYAERNCKASDFPVAYDYQDEILFIPMFAELTQGQLSYDTSTWYLS